MQNFEKSVKLLDKRDMGLYGTHPETDPFELVVCGICSTVVKLEALKRHNNLRHSVHINCSDIGPYQKAGPDHFGFNVRIKEKRINSKFVKNLPPKTGTHKSKTRNSNSEKSIKKNIPKGSTQFSKLRNGQRRTSEKIQLDIASILEPDFDRKIYSAAETTFLKSAAGDEYISALWNSEVEMERLLSTFRIHDVVEHSEEEIPVEPKLDLNVEDIDEEDLCIYESLNSNTLERRSAQNGDNCVESSDLTVRYNYPPNSCIYTWVQKPIKVRPLFRKKIFTAYKVLSTIPEEDIW